MDRRSFIRAALGRWRGHRQVNLGFIALTDCAPIVMAQELGYYDERDLEVAVIKQASWRATRDALLAGQIDGAHCLFGMPFSLATGIGGTSREWQVAMMLNQNGQAITLPSALADAGYGDLDAAHDALASAGTPALGMTVPGGTHDIWLRYWPPATGTSLDDVKIDPVVLGNPPRPSVTDVIPVELPRPRDRVSVIDDPHYREIQARLLHTTLTARTGEPA